MSSTHKLLKSVRPHTFSSTVIVLPLTCASSSSLMRRSASLRLSTMNARSSALPDVRCAMIPSYETRKMSGHAWPSTYDAGRRVGLGGGRLRRLELGNALVGHFHALRHQVCFGHLPVPRIVA
jgi:hypothetical protein